jgi:oligoribonuclease
MIKKATLLWLDLEMTGVDVKGDVILEAAAIATDWGFKEIATFVGVVRQDEALMRTQMAKAKDVWTGKSFWDENPEARDALFTQNTSGKPEAEVEQALIDFIKAHFNTDDPVYLAGNSIHNDRRFIYKHMPRLDETLHYRMLDVTAWKLIFENKFHKKFASPKSHRALDDIRRSISELEYYLKKVKT